MEAKTGFEASLDNFNRKYTATCTHSVSFTKNINLQKLRNKNKNAHVMMPSDYNLYMPQAIFGGVIRPQVQIWCTQAKGPFYVPMFKPFGILYACFFAVCFFANSLHYGR